MLPIHKDYDLQATMTCKALTLHTQYRCTCIKEPIIIYHLGGGSGDFILGGGGGGITRFFRITDGEISRN